MRKLFSYSFEKWWIVPLFSLFIIGLSFIFNSIWFVILGIVLVAVAVIYQFAKKGWKMGCLAGTAMLVVIALSFFWFALQLFPTPRKIHRQYSKQYENRSEIQRIIGVEIPKFKVINSQLNHLNGFDFEFEVQCTIEFNTLPDDKLFTRLDSICNLPVPPEPDENSSYFYYGIGDIYPCWSKDGNKYKYVRISDSGEKFLHSRDAYFNFEMTKGAKTAEIEYGNY